MSITELTNQAASAKLRSYGRGIGEAMSITELTNQAASAKLRSYGRGTEMNHFSFGECPLCRQGELWPVSRCDTGALLLMCDECESQWDSPKAPLAGNALKIEHKTKPATDVEVRSANWRAISIAAHLDRFLSGEDSGILAANRLESLLDAEFPNDALVQEVIDALAQYRPGGGDLLFDIEDIRHRIVAVRTHILRDSQNASGR